jgi:hypothetical protein
MSDSIAPSAPALAVRTPQAFPKLTPAQIERIRLHGRERQVRKGEVLVEQGDAVVPFSWSRQEGSKSSGRSAGSRRQSSSTARESSPAKPT